MKCSSFSQQKLIAISEINQWCISMKFHFLILLKGKYKVLKKITHGIPLHLPDKFIGTDMSFGSILTHNFLYKMITLKQDGGDAEKFRNGRNCYVDGASYSKLISNVKV